MCEFVSWKEYKDKLYYLTKHDLNTKRGLELKKFLHYPSIQYYDDICGHGAIDFYYNIHAGKGIKREITVFTSPANFPAEIAEAIKRGDFEGIGLDLALLNTLGREEYEKIKQSAFEEFEKIEQSAWRKYKKIQRPAREKYEKIEQSVREEYEKIEQSDRREYLKIEQSARKDYEKIKQPALKEYKKIEQSAGEEYKKIEQSAFWKLFASPEYRAKAWL